MKFIYESPDGGKTVYRTPIGSDKRQLIKSAEPRMLSVIDHIVTDDGHVIVVVEPT